MRDSRYEVFEDAAGEWRWRLRAANGLVVAAGEGYKRKGGAQQGVRAHRRAAATSRVDVLKSMPAPQLDAAGYPKV
jgi:uncharacterized protein YegP (UPF0339 family)